MKLISLVVATGLLWQTQLTAEEEHRVEPETQPMTVEQLDDLILGIDPAAKRRGTSQWQLTLGDRPLLVIADPRADRMRIMTSIESTEILTEQLLLRLMQANYDSALDARYAVADKLIWGVFIHSLGELTDRLFLSGIAQVVSVAETFGSTYTSGAFTYRGGDSAELQRELLEQLEKAPQEGI